MALADLHLGAMMIVMIHRNFRGKEGRIKQNRVFLNQSFLKIIAMCNFKITSRLFVVLLLIFLVIGWKVKTAQTQSTGDKPVEQVRKNIQVLKGLPDSQLFLLMNFVGDSLGVNCDHCHVKGEKNPQSGRSD